MSKRYIRKEKGITLIALVITIIVLLILAGVSIATLTGDNGIITKATQAKDDTVVAQEKELIQLAYVAAMDESNGNVTREKLQEELNNLNANATATDGEEEEEDIDVTFKETTHRYTVHQCEEEEKGKITGPEEGEGPTEPKEPPKTVEEAKERDYTFDNKTTLEDDNKKPVPVPGKFKIASDSATDVDGGVVIEDTREETKESQFVWIPVTSEDDYVRNTTYEDINISNGHALDDKNYLPEDLESQVTDEKKEGDIEKETVVSAKGFYIGRYEAGKEGESEPYTLVSKKDAIVWDEIAQEDCKTKSKGFIDNTDVKSGLITGIQWDVVMKFVNGKNDERGESFNVETQSNSRHTNSLAESGKNEDDKVCNIYDLEGNCYEYVAEKNDYNTFGPYVKRGGNCNYNNPASNRNYTNGTAFSAYSFRLALYVM